MSRDRNEDQIQNDEVEAPKPLKLKLSRETLRLLSRDQLPAVAGGVPPEHSFNPNETGSYCE